MAISISLWFWIWAILTSLHGTCASDSYTNAWEKKSTSINDLNGVLFVNNQFVAYGRLGKIGISDDGDAWTIKSTISSRRFYGIAYGNTKYVAVAQGTTNEVLATSDVNTWGMAQNMEWAANALAFDGTKFIAGGASLSYKSTDGSSWSVVEGPADSWEINNIIYANSQVVACGNGIYSLTGNSWIRKASSTNNLYALAYGNGIYVAVGKQGTFLRSTDGETWTAGSIPDSKDLWGVAFGLNTFIIANSDGEMYGSRDGSEWVKQINSAAIELGDQAKYNNHSNHLAFGKGVFVVVGADSIYTAADISCPCDVCAECQTSTDCVSISCLWDSANCVSDCSSSECSSCSTAYSCGTKGDSCKWDADTSTCLKPKEEEEEEEEDGADGSGYVSPRPWAWFLMICLSIIILH